MKLAESKQKALPGYFLLAARLALGGILLWSCLPKLYQPYDFLSNVYQYELVGPKLGMLVAMALPWMELILGICLLGGIFSGGALLATVALMAVFVFCQGSALYHGLAIACGCFETSNAGFISYATLLRTLLFLALALAGYVCFVFAWPSMPRHHQVGNA